MYNVNREKIEDILLNMSDVLNIIKPVISMNQDEFLKDQIIVLATERAMHISIESIVDVGNLIIDGFIMRDPGSYIDIIEILRDEQVLPEVDADTLKEFMAFRKSLVHEYTLVQPEELYNLMVKGFQTVLDFKNHIRVYLTKELD